MAPQELADAGHQDFPPRAGCLGPLGVAEPGLTRTRSADRVSSAHSQYTFPMEMLLSKGKLRHINTVKHGAGVGTEAAGSRAGLVWSAVSALVLPPRFLGSRGDCLAMGIRATSASGLADSVVLSWRLEYRKQLRAGKRCSLPEALAVSELPTLLCSQRTPSWPGAGAPSALVLCSLTTHSDGEGRGPQTPLQGTGAGQPPGREHQPHGSSSRLHWPSFCPEGQSHTVGCGVLRQRDQLGPTALALSPRSQTRLWPHV